MDQDGNAEIRDFTIVWKPKQFRIDDDVFEAQPLLALSVLSQLAKIGGGLQGLAPEQMVERFTEVFDLILKPASAERFRQRIAGEGDTPPLDLQQQLLPIVLWLLEAYGMRPTEPSQNSSTSPNSTGEPSTDGAQLTASTPLPQLTEAGLLPGGSST